LSRFAKLLLLVGIAGTLAAAAQSPSATNFVSLTYMPPPPEVNPVAHVREAQSWEYGPFINYGTGVGNRSSYKFLWAGVQLSKPLSPVVHAGFLSGQFEFGGNIMPLWQAYTPAPHLENFVCGSSQGGSIDCKLPVGGGTFRGVSLTPVILRWNFLTRSRRIQPWFQGAGGLIYTTHKFPPNVQSTQPVNGVPGIDGGTCVWNFTPQGGAYFHRRQALLGRRRERRPHLLGLARRPQPRRQCQRPGTSGLHILEVIFLGFRRGKYLAIIHLK